MKDIIEPKFFGLVKFGLVLHPINIRYIICRILILIIKYISILIVFIKYCEVTII